MVEGNVALQLLVRASKQLRLACLLAAKIPRRQEGASLA